MKHNLQHSELLLEVGEVAMCDITKGAKRMIFVSHRAQQKLIVSLDHLVSPLRGDQRLVEICQESSRQFVLSSVALGSVRQKPPGSFPFAKLTETLLLLLLLSPRRGSSSSISFFLSHWSEGWNLFGLKGKFSCVSSVIDDETATKTAPAVNSSLATVPPPFYEEPVRLGYMTCPHSRTIGYWLSWKWDGAAGAASRW